MTRKASSARCAGCGWSPPVGADPDSEGWAHALRSFHHVELLAASVFGEPELEVVGTYCRVPEAWSSTAGGRGVPKGSRRMMGCGLCHPGLAPWDPSKLQPMGGIEVN